MKSFVLIVLFCISLVKGAPQMQPGMGPPMGNMGPPMGAPMGPPMNNMGGNYIPQQYGGMYGQNMPYGGSQGVPGAGYGQYGQYGQYGR